MFPLAKNRQDASVVSEPDVLQRDSVDYDMMESAAEDLMHAIHAKDIKAIASALKAAFEIADAQPHEEGEHV